MRLTVIGNTYINTPMLKAAVEEASTFNKPLPHAVARQLFALLWTLEGLTIDADDSMIKASEPTTNSETRPW